MRVSKGKLSFRVYFPVSNLAPRSAPHYDRRAYG